MLQGVVSGITLALGYGLGVASEWLWRYLQLAEVHGPAKRTVKTVLSVAAGAILAYFYGHATLWQNSIRELMDMPPVEGASLILVTGLALGLAFALVLIARGTKALYGAATKQIYRLVPRRVSYVVGSFLLTFLLVTLINGIFVKRVVDVLDGMYAQADELTPDGIEAPTQATRSGSPSSLVAFEDLGKTGKEFVAQGPRARELEQFSGRPAKNPIRVYVGLPAADSIKAQAELALKELTRTGAFDRSILVITTPTGTGWVDPGSVDTLEYLHNGDTAMVAVQYSYLSSPVTLILDPNRARNSARIVFSTIYDHWRSLPKNARPKLYLHGLSLGSLGAEDSTPLYRLIADPIDGAFYAGPPFANSIWPRLKDARNADSPAWLPTFEDGSLVRFLGQDTSQPKNHSAWGPLRVVYLLYPSDAIVFFRPSLFYKEPDWLKGTRGPDVSPHLSWYPLITFWQVGIDMLVTTRVPHGHGHNYDPGHYLDGWVEMTDPKHWTEEDSVRLKALLRQPL